MKCCNHPDRDAVASCKICGKALCNECAEQFAETMCEDCAWQYVHDTYSQEKRYFISHSIIGVVLAFLGVSLFGSAWCLLAFFLAFGWVKKDAEARLHDTIGYSGRHAGGYLIGSIIGFCIKVVLCAVLGIPNFIKRLVVLIQDTKYIKSIENPDESLAASEVLA